MKTKTAQLMSCTINRRKLRNQTKKLPIQPKLGMKFSLPKDSLVFIFLCFNLLATGGPSGPPTALYAKGGWLESAPALAWPPTPPHPTPDANETAPLAQTLGGSRPGEATPNHPDQQTPSPTMRSGTRDVKWCVIYWILCACKTCWRL